MVTISHSAAKGTLIEGTSRGDGTNEALKALGWRWFRSLGTWGIRGSRDRAPKLHLIESTAAALRAAGFEVRIEIDATARPTAEVEADRIERQAGRVAALEDKAQRRADQADQAWEADRRAHDALPEGGEPIHVGHHSERRHRRAIETAHRTLGQAVAAEEEAKAARRRAESAAVTTSARYNPETVKNRIDSLQASQRADQRLLDGHERTLFVVRGVKQVEKTAPVEGAYRESVIARMEERADQISYWEGVRAEQIASGQATNYGPDDIAKGDQVQRRGQWYRVVRVNRKTVSIPSIVGGRWTDKVAYHELSGHIRAEAQKEPVETFIAVEDARS
ncbi:DUF3560 domain-containing protein (plasmid) [Rhodococcus opacus]